MVRFVVLVLVCSVTAFLGNKIFHGHLVSIATKEEILTVVTFLVGVVFATAIIVKLLVREESEMVRQSSTLQKSLEVAVKESCAAIDVLRSHNTRMSNLTSMLSSLPEQLDVSQDIASLEEEVKGVLAGLAVDLQRRGFSIMWNSLPYHERFETFSDDQKIKYFNAITSGDWRQINASLRR